MNPPIPLDLGRRVGARTPISVPTKAIDPKPPSRAYSDWIEQEISLSIELDNGEIAAQKIRARVKSVFGVHKHVPSQSYKTDEVASFGLTHLPTGVRTVATNNEEDAFKIGEKLLQICKKALFNNTLKGVKEAIPESVKKWAKACHVARKYIDPESYGL